MSARRAIGFVLAAACAAALGAGPASCAVLEPALTPSVLQVDELAPRPTSGVRQIDGNPLGWHGADSHFAGSSHYDSGEWIYEDYLFDAFGAAAPGTSQITQLTQLPGELNPTLERLSVPARLAAPSFGAGPMEGDADLSELRFATDGTHLNVLARFTTMPDHPASALLLLFDVHGSGVKRQIPLGSGLTSAAADVAVLISAHGARIVDLATGRETTGPAAADSTGYLNGLEGQLPLSTVARGDGTFRFVAATGLITADGSSLQPRGEAGPLYNVAPRLHEPVNPDSDELQAQALAAHDIDRFFCSVSLQKLRRGDRERLTAGSGWVDRTIQESPAVSVEHERNSVLQEYGLYLPVHPAAGPLPATVFLHGSGFGQNDHATLNPGIYRELGDSTGTVVITPGGRSGFSFFEGGGYLDALDTLADVRSLLPIDRRRITVAGYSMGGFGTYLMADTQPDLFAAAFVIEGPVGGSVPNNAALLGYHAPDLLPGLENASQIPIEIYQGTNDQNVPATNALAAADRLKALGYRYRLRIYPGEEHYSPGIVEDMSDPAQFLATSRLNMTPSVVHLIRRMAFEHAVSTAVGSDDVRLGHDYGLRFDHAWFLSGLQAVDPVNGIADALVRTLARPLQSFTPESSISGPASYGAITTAQTWRPASISPAVGNGFVATLHGVSSVTLDLRGMGLTLRRLSGRITCDDTLRLTLLGRSRRSPRAVIDGHRIRVRRRGSQVVIVLPAGTHTLRVR